MFSFSDVNEADVIGAPNIASTYLMTYIITTM